MDTKPCETRGETEMVENVEIHDPNTTRTSRKAIVATCAVCFIFFAQLVSVVGSGSLATPTATLLGDSSKSVWFSTIITIFTLALAPPISQAADFWGRKSLVLITSMAGIAGPLVISRANNIGAAMAGFCLLGIAFGCQSLCYAIPSEILPRRHRSVSQAAVNMSSGAGAIVAILMGGALLRDDDVENYRIFWYVTAGIYAAGCLGVLVGYNPPPRELQSSLTKYEKLRRLDWIGIALIATGLSLVAIGLQWYGNPYSFTEAPVLAPFIIGVGLIIGFGLYEWRGRCHGILHHALFQHRNFALALGIVFIEGLAFFTANSYFIYELTVLYGLDTFDAGLRFMILFLASIVFAFVVGAYTMRTKQIREPMIIGFALLIAFNALLATLEPSTPLANLWGYAVLGGSGIGFILTNVMVAAQMSTPADMISVTSGLMTATRSLGGAVGLAINNAIFSNSLSSNIFPKISAAVLPLGFPQAELTDLVHAIISGNPHSVEQLPGASAEIVGAALSASKDAYVASFRNAWIAAACFSAVGFLGVCFVRNNKTEFTTYIDAPVSDRVVGPQAELERGEAIITNPR